MRVGVLKLMLRSPLEALQLLARRLVSHGPNCFDVANARMLEREAGMPLPNGRMSEMILASAAKLGW